MQELTVLFIHTAYRVQSHQWVVNEDGLVSYNEELIQPNEVFPRFIVNYPMFKVCRVEVCKRIETPDEARNFAWITLDRFY